jgi:hypothetical protein
MSVHDHDILVPFAGEMVCQRQSEDACANDDNPVAWAHHSRVELLDVLQAHTLRKLVIVNKNIRYALARTERLYRTLLRPTYSSTTND